MARLKDHKKALALRRQGMSYGQIKRILKVNKSTLSLWLRNYPLSKQRIRELRDRNEKRIEKFRTTMKKKKEKKLQEIYKKQKKNILPLKKRELFLLGLGLYWGEGRKCKMNTLSISNTDPSIVKFFIYWLNRTLQVPQDRIRATLHLYNDMDVKKEIEFWSTALNLPLSQFTRPYIKKTSIKRINHKGGFGHGTCEARLNNITLGEKVLMGLKAISDQYNKNYKMRT